MLYNLLFPLAVHVQFFNLFRYLTFRSGGAILTAMIISFVVGPRLIRWLRVKQSGGQPIRSDGPESHLLTKKGTPTMGGLMMLFAVTISTILWADITNHYVWIALFVTLGYGMIGFMDDYLKVSKKNSKGLPGRKKLIAQFVIGLVAALWVSAVTPETLNHHLAFPFIKNFLLDLGFFYAPFVIIVLIGASNAVNLTDGLDGLAIVPIMIAAACFGLISYVVGSEVYAPYLHLPLVNGSGELAVFCAAMIGAGLGFLWYNAPPAMVFMGDTGSLAFGGALGTIAVITKHEIVLAIIGGLFVLEAVSVIVQVASFKLTGKRVFRMAPIHHHFENWLEGTNGSHSLLDYCGYSCAGRAFDIKITMITLPFAADKIYGVVGLGKSGQATIASLLASGARVIAWDDHAAARAAVKNEFAAVTMIPVAEWPFAELVGVIMSPGIALTHPAAIAANDRGVEVLGDVELLWRAQPEAQYIAITGTNGKSTTTTLVGHILHACGKRVEVGGNLGTPALALGPLGLGGTYVLELSSYQLDLVRTTRFGTAVLLNISPDHLDHHGTMAEYIAAKKHIFDRQTMDDIAIVGIDDTESFAIAETLQQTAPEQCIQISAAKELMQGVFVRDAVLHYRWDEKEWLGNLADIKSLQGAHNGQNAAAAYAVCISNGCTHDAIMAAMQTYPGLAHRMEWLGEIAGVAFVNDSKATNADAAEKALLTYDRIFWIAGGISKEGGIASLAPYFPKIRHAYLVGEAASAFAETLEGHVASTQCVTLENAFRAAADAATKAAAKSKQTMAVVLSPACASFDQFANFEKRGEAFAQLVQEWKQNHAA